MAKLLKNDLIILDEWGYLPLHQEGARLLFEVIGKCYEQKSLIITTNMEFSHWKNFLFDEKLTIAILDRSYTTPISSFLTETAGEKRELL